MGVRRVHDREYKHDHKDVMLIASASIDDVIYRA